jgi:2-polyprenyl-6-methoxyphenol hydroxylase-like FAD-dependent oxidoreductase
VPVPRWWLSARHDGARDEVVRSGPKGLRLAAEDALVLAELLATREDWATVGSEFDGRRRLRVEHLQKMTDRLSRTVVPPNARCR